MLTVGKVLFQLATAQLYGAHHDEFYYLAGGHHIAWGYVDHPPTVPALDRLAELVFGHSIAALHVVPALIGGVLCCSVRSWPVSWEAGAGLDVHHGGGRDRADLPRHRTLPQHGDARPRGVGAGVAPRDPDDPHP